MCAKMFAASVEIYSAAERAPAGAAFPCRRDVVALDVDEVYDEVRAPSLGSPLAAALRCRRD